MDQKGWSTGSGLSGQGGNLKKQIKGQAKHGVNDGDGNTLKHKMRHNKITPWGWKHKAMELKKF